MADTAADTTTTDDTTTSTTTTTDTSTDTGDTTDWQAEAEKWKATSRKHEERAKTNAAAAKELEQFRQQHMTDQEKAVEQARSEARAETLKATGAKVVVAEIRAAAAGRFEKDQLDELIDGIDKAKFLDEDGDVDADKVQRFVDGIAPKPTEPGFPDLGQGARGAGTGGNADPLLATVKKFAGTSG